MQTAQTTYLSRLDHLRFLAAALVVQFHFFHAHVGDLRAGNPLVSLIDEGHTGIALFMVISGFIFTVIAGDRELRYGGFLRNRILRIYPLFIVAVFLQLFINTYNNHANYGFLQLLGWLMPFRSETVPLSPYFSQLWTIWVEFQFYLIFPFLLAFTRRTGPRYLFGLLLLLLLLRVLVYAASGSVRFIAYETLFGRLDQFLIGMLLGLAWLRRPIAAAGLAPGWLALAGGLMLAGLHLFSRKVGYSELDSAFWIVWPLVEALLWAGVVWTYLLARWPGPAGLRARVDRGLAALGAVSFSTYIMHNLVIAAYNKTLPLLPWGLGTAKDALLTGALVVLPAVLALSALTYRLIEKPFLSLRGGYLSPKG
jgi:peptidoglycan/LPS O-acetylase OafA/YrhL